MENKLVILRINDYDNILYLSYLMTLKYSIVNKLY